jgi:hypothetical protein
MSLIDRLNELSASLDESKGRDLSEAETGFWETYRSMKRKHPGESKGMHLARAAHAAPRSGNAREYRDNFMAAAEQFLPEFARVVGQFEKLALDISATARSYAKHSIMLPEEYKAMSESLRRLNGFYQDAFLEREQLARNLKRWGR